MKNRNEHGFTLMEMVVAIFIVALMMAVVMPHLAGIGGQAQKIACEENQRTIRAALMEYDLLNHQYPTGDTNMQLMTLVSAGLLDSVPREPAGGNYVIQDSDDNHVEVSCDIHGELGVSENNS